MTTLINGPERVVPEDVTRPTLIPRPRPQPPQPATPYPFPDGTLIKGSGPEVDMVQLHERRWIPDPQTFNYMGLNWGEIKAIPDATWHQIPVGPPFPSRVDGNLLKGSGAAVYVMQGGQRRLIPDQATFDALGYSWAAVQSIADNDLNAIPQGSPMPEGGSVQPAFPIVASQDNNFPGSGGFMHTDATIFATGLLNGVTHTWEVTDLRGFRGAVAVAVLDKDQHVLWVSGTQNYGVDGKWVGTSDRTDNWTANVPPEILPDIRFIAIIQQWNPNNVYNDIQVWLGGLTNVATQLAGLLQAVGTVATAAQAL